LEQIDKVFLEPCGVVVCRQNHAHRGQGVLREVAGAFGGFAFAVPAADAKMEQSVVKAAENQSQYQQDGEYNRLCIS
jgi:hypothetical protein